MNVERPQSVTHMPTNLLGLVALVAVSWLLWRQPGISRDVAVPLLMVATALPILVADVLVFKVYRRASTGIDWSVMRTIDLPRLGTKLVGFAAALTLILVAYNFTPEYAGSFYDAYYRFLWRLGPPVLIAMPLYFAWMDRVLVEPRDKYWHLGALVTGQADADAAKALDLVRGWVIKGFFIPLMYVYAFNNVGELRNLAAGELGTFMDWYRLLFSFGMLVDVIFTTMGYLISLRIIDTHLRSSEPTMTGWVVAIVCYQPFFDLFYQQYFSYNNGYYWNDWLASVPALLVPWGVAILFANVVFFGSTITFGCRFSNLTNRGVVTDGFYRFTKHPAYWSKLFGFYLAFVPFVPHGGPLRALRDSVSLGLLGGVYFLRARTEEAHLSTDPDYVRYAEWINEHGVFAFLGRWIPALRYRSPAGDEDETAA